jgi:hypothetical protein
MANPSDPQQTSSVSPSVSPGSPESRVSGDSLRVPAGWPPMRRRERRARLLDLIAQQVERGELVIRYADPAERERYGIKLTAIAPANSESGPPERTRTGRGSVPSQAGEPPAGWLRAEQIAAEIGCGRTWPHGRASELGGRMFTGRFGRKLMFPPEALERARQLRAG